MKKPWTWLMRMLRWIGGLFRREEKIEGLPLEELRWKSPKWFKRTFKLIDTTHHGYPNMPKYQPCPIHGGWRKRAGKTVGGAYYWCSACLVHFFVGCA